MRWAVYSTSKPEDRAIMHGMTPDSVLKVTGSALEFWMSQQQNRLEFTQHKLRKSEVRVEELTSQAEKACKELLA